MEIKRWDTGDVIISGDETTLRDLVQRAAIEKKPLYRANLYKANLTGASLPNFSIVPDAGSFTAWKKVKSQTGDDVILELIVPSDAQRVSSLVGRKCRVSCARPIQATAIDGTVINQSETWHSTHKNTFTYQIDTLAQVDNFDNDIRVECAPGIHCFITRKEACEF